MASPRLASLLKSGLLPHRFVAAQLRRPTGRFGRWVMTRSLDRGNAELIEATLDALALGPADRFLDVGFGGGAALRGAAERIDGPLFGVDFSPDVVAGAYDRLGELIAGGRLAVLTADVADLPLRDGLVTAICTTNTIYFWPDLPRALGELRRVLAPRGRVAFGYAGRAKMEGFDQVTRHGFRTFEPGDLEAPLAEAGFVDIATTALSGGAIEGDFVTLAHRP